MYRRVVISSESEKTGQISVDYYVSDACVLSQRKNIRGGVDYGVPIVIQQTPNVFNNCVRLLATGPVTDKISFEFILDVPENQPVEESVKETTSTGVSITVYNAHGVVVCHNDVGVSADSNPPKTNISGEMVSEPIGGTGETTSEPIDGTGETTSEPIGGTGEMTSEPIGDTGEMTSEPIGDTGETPSETIDGTGDMM